MLPAPILVLSALLAQAPEPTAPAGEEAAPRPRPGCVPGPALLLHGLGTPEEDLRRLGELAGVVPPSPDLIRHGGPRVAPTCEGFEAFGWGGRLARLPEGDAWVTAPPVRLVTTFDSGYPSGGNDGLLWEGRGVSTLATAGVTARWGPLTVAVAPAVAWQQNDWFETQPIVRPGGQPFESRWYAPFLDLPQRPGAGPVARASLGQSEVRLTVLGASAGVSSANLWLGPGLHDALILTDEADGFPHLFLGTARPLETPIGSFEALLLWGAVSRTAGFPTTGQKWLNALAVDWQPTWVPGLSLGLGRAFLETSGGLRDNAFLPVLQPPLKHWVRGGDNPNDNQVAAAWYRWVFPESGLELYGEWGRDDFPVSFEGLVREPEHTQGWIAGLQKLFGDGPRRVRLQVELCRLHEGRPLDARGGVPSWYVHPADLGWTNGGQLLGASIGPGGDAQRLAIDVLSPSGRIGGFLERKRRNEEIYWAVIEPLGPSHDHDAELALGAEQVLFAGPVELAWSLATAYRWERDFIANARNVRATLRLAWTPGASPR